MPFLYDFYCQHACEDNKTLDKSFYYGYNDIGNVVCVATYDYTTGVLGNAREQKCVAYDTTYPDRLITYDCEDIGYNTMGCPINYDGYTASWLRGKLSMLSKGNTLLGAHTYSYTYNAYGQRIGIDYTYTEGTDAISSVATGMLTGYNKTFRYDQSGRLICENKTNQYYGQESSTEKIVYLYDESSMIGMVYTVNGASNTYYFQRNLFGDVIAITDVSPE